MKSVRIVAALCAVAIASYVFGDVTGPAGGNTPISTIQPSLGVKHLIRMYGIFPSENGSPVGSLGEIIQFGGNFVPDGYAETNGQLLSIAQNTALFSLLGTTWGGDGITTFGLPNLGGRALIGSGQGPGLGDRIIGQFAGAEQLTLNVSNLPSHAHSLPTNPPTTTSFTGSNVPYNNMQPSAVINYIVPLEGIYPGRDGSVIVGSDPTLGFVYQDAAPFAATLWTTASGQLMPIAQNTAVFSLLGTTYGGDGVTTFRLPDLRGRAPIGVGQGPGLSNQSLGQVMGSEASSLSIAQMPDHDHSIIGPDLTGITGGNQPQSTMQPTLGLHSIIAIQGIFPSRGGGGGTPEEPLLGQIALFASNFAPSGWAFCDGQILSIASNTALFSLLGTTFGGDGITTFALPNLDGRLSVDDGQGLGLSNVLLGQVYGQENITLSDSQMPQHTHEYTVPEPGSMLFMFVGAMGLMIRRRR